MNRKDISKIFFIGGSIAMGLAIVTMHYTGMASMEMQAVITYNPVLFASSVVIAVTASAGALWLAFNLKRDIRDLWFYQKVLSAIVMGFAIAGMHYTGMAAASYQHTGDVVSGLTVPPTVGAFYLSDLLVGASILFGFALLLLGAHATGERQRALEALRKSEERYELVMKGSSDGLWDWDHLSNTIFWNKRCYDQVGIPYDTVITSELFLSLIHPDDKERSLQIIYAHLEHNEPYEVEFRLKHASGEYGYFLARGKSVRDENGKPVRTAGTRVDISRQKHIEEELRKSLKDLADIKFALDQSTIVAITDKKGDITYVNDAFCRISKYSEQELLGQNHRIINSGHHPHEFFVEMWRQISHGEVWKGEIKNRAKDGTFYWVDTTIVPFLDPKHKPYQYVAIRHDITTRKELELQLEEAKEVAEVANRKKSQFLANMSHELRTPLNAVIGYSEMMLNGMAGELNPKQEKYANAVAFSGHHLLDMVNDILDLSKVEAGKTELNYEPIELGPLLKGLLDVLNVQAQGKQVELSLYIQPDLDGVYADPARFKQMVFNLASNAIKFNKEGGEVHIRITKSEDNEWVVCEVKDTGIGIPKENIDGLFTEFYQVDNSMARKYEGTGLGLALTKHLVELHGGCISVESEEGVGSVFTFKLPAKAPVKVLQELN